MKLTESRMKRSHYTSLPTPCFIFRRSVFMRTVQAFTEAMDAHFQGRSKVAYSVKTNSHPLVLQAIKEAGLMAEVVSADEYRLVRSLGFSPAQVVYNGPLKDAETFREAMNGGAVVNIETWREIDWLRDVKPRGVGLRISVNLSHISSKDAIRPDDASRFGFNTETDEASRAISLIRQIPGIDVCALHLHRNTDARRVAFYSALASYAADLAARFKLKPDILDIGGGFHFPGPGKPSFLEYFQAISTSLTGTTMAKATLLAEPGNALVATAFQYITEVIDVKDDHVTVDGTRNDIDPLYHRMDHDRRIIRSDSSDGMDIVARQTVGGCTCMERDVLFSEVDAPALRIGDRIVFRNVGAYTMALAPRFIRRAAPVIPVP